VVTIVGLSFGRLLSGAVVTESVFAWPGLGLYAFRSATSLDFPAIMGVGIDIATIYDLVNQVVDIAYGLTLDSGNSMATPRISYSAEAVASRRLTAGRAASWLHPLSLVAHRYGQPGGCVVGAGRRRVPSIDRAQRTWPAPRSPTQPTGWARTCGEGLSRILYGAHLDSVGIAAVILARARTIVGSMAGYLGGLVTGRCASPTSCWPSPRSSSLS
jgi:hypothetical protein